jgi:hypothetical protein
MLLLSFPLWFACTEEIEIELDDSFTRLVVEGGITNEAGPHSISLSYTGSYYENATAAKAEGARLRISDGNQVYALTETEPGLYQSGPELVGVPGNTYTLFIDSVWLDDRYQFFTASCFMPEVPPVDSIRIAYNPSWDIWGVHLYAWDPPSKEHYLFRVYKNGLLMSDTIDEYIVINDDFFNGNYTFGVMVQWLEVYEAQSGDSISLEMGSITREYANFIEDVQAQTGFNSPLFSGPPANIRGNIDNGAIGFFWAYSRLIESALVP